MSYPPLRSWPISGRDFPPPKPRPRLDRLRKWLWGSSLALFVLTLAGGSLYTAASTGLLAGAFTFICLVATGLLSFVAALLAGFALGVFEFGGLKYELRVELCTVVLLILTFAGSTTAGFMYGWFSLA